MNSTEFEQELAQERRGRLAAERMLEHKQAELQAANRQLSEHALALSDQIVDQRQVVSDLRGEKSKVSQDLERANTRVVAVERLLWASLETIPDGFALFGPDFRLIAANDPYLAVFEETSGIGPGDSYQAILDVCLDDGLVDLQGQNEDTWYDTMLDRWNDPKIPPVTLRFWNGMHIKMVDRRTADGGIVSLALNITDDILREEELREARDKAQAADRAKSAFLAKMSHELRTPMNGVVGMADLLMERGLDAESHLYTETIRNSGQALLDIINEILDFSRIEADRVNLRENSVDLPGLVQDVLLLFQPTLRDKPIEMHLDYDPSLATHFLGDAGRLRQILVNLVGNAIKFTETGHVLLRVSSALDPKSNVVISVEDTGVGIPDGLHDHIFGEFNQVEDNEDRQAEGTGLGLAITRKLVEAMGGTLWVDSVDGRGSCFGFALNLPQDGDASAPPPVSTPDLSRALLWVEDPLDCKIFERLLGSLGIEVWATGETSEFGLALERRSPHLVICEAGRREAVTALLAKHPTEILLLTISGKPGTQDNIDRPFLRNVVLSKIQALTSADKSPANERVRVLAAEDNKTNQLVLSKMLDGLDIDLTLVEDGAQAIANFKQQTPDLILLDISMPKMDGMEVARKIRSLEGGTSHVPIIAMTAHAMTGDEERIRASGIDHYLTKPLNKLLVRSHVEALTLSASTVQEIAR